MHQVSSKQQQLDFLANKIAISKGRLLLNSSFSYMECGTISEEEFVSFFDENGIEFKINEIVGRHESASYNDFTPENRNASCVIEYLKNFGDTCTVSIWYKRVNSYHNTKEVYVMVDKVALGVLRRLQKAHLVNK